MSSARCCRRRSNRAPRLGDRLPLAAARRRLRRPCRRPHAGAARRSAPSAGRRRRRQGGRGLAPAVASARALPRPRADRPVALRPARTRQSAVQRGDRPRPPTRRSRHCACSPTAASSSPTPATRGRCSPTRAACARSRAPICRWGSSPGPATRPASSASRRARRSCSTRTAGPRRRTPPTRSTASAGQRRASAGPRDCRSPSSWPPAATISRSSSAARRWATISRCSRCAAARREIGDWPQVGLRSRRGASSRPVSAACWSRRPWRSRALRCRAGWAGCAGRTASAASGCGSGRPGRRGWRTTDSS